MARRRWLAAAWRRVPRFVSAHLSQSNCLRQRLARAMVASCVPLCPQEGGCGDDDVGGGRSGQLRANNKQPQLNSCAAITPPLGRRAGQAQPKQIERSPGADGFCALTIGTWLWRGKDSRRRLRKLNQLHTHTSIGLRRANNAVVLIDDCPKAPLCSRRRDMKAEGWQPNERVLCNWTSGIERKMYIGSGESCRQKCSLSRSRARSSLPGKS